jgi:cell division protein FtsI (penicillin-binding protein 3)
MNVTERRAPHPIQLPRPRDIIHTEGEARRVIEVGRTRLLIAAALFAVAFSIVAIRLVGVGLWQQGGGDLAATDDAPTAAAARGDIVDRNGIVLATNLASASLFANPKQIIDAADAARLLGPFLTDMTRSQIEAKLRSDKSFVWLKRHLTPREHSQIIRLGVPGLGFKPESRRVYPQGGLAAHVVGFTDIDNDGISGIEQSFDDVLEDGYEPVRLSIDLRIQHILREELARAMAEFRGIGAAGITLDAQTGEVLALVSLPDFDPNLAGSAPEIARFNRATLGVYEMGSTFKIFNTAMALDRGVVDLDDRFDATNPIRVSGFTITDYKPKNRWLSVPEILIYSSNIGSARMALDVGGPAQQDFFRRLGMFDRSSIELPETGTPTLPSPWRPINTMTIAYGHGIAVTPVHLAASAAAMVNGGIMRPATLIKRQPGQIPDGERIVSAQTSASMRELLRLVVQSGTGRKAEAPGYLVGGKTGTADKQMGRGYSDNANLASFVGAFPMSAPRYVILAMIDEPKPSETSQGYATGGWVAAPVIRNVVERMAPLLGIEPIEDTAPDAPSDLLIAASTAE